MSSNQQDAFLWLKKNRAMLSPDDPRIHWVLTASHGNVPLRKAANATGFESVRKRRSKFQGWVFEEGTQRYFKVERRVNNGEFTWADLPSDLRREIAEVGPYTFESVVTDY